MPRKKTENFNKPALTADEVEPGEFAPKAGRLKEVRGKWPDDEPIEELLAMLEGDSERTKSVVGIACCKEFVIETVRYYLARRDS